MTEVTAKRIRIGGIALAGLIGLVAAFFIPAPGVMIVSVIVGLAIGLGVQAVTGEAE